MPPVNICAEAKAIVPETDWFRNKDTFAEPPFAMAKSKRPSPSKSAIATDDGLVPVVKVSACVVKLMVLLEDVLLKIDTKPRFEFTSTTSGQPSPSISPTATEEDTEPTAPVKAIADPKLVDVAPAVVLGNIDAVLFALATTKSGFPSRFKSRMATLVGAAPADNVVLGKNELSPVGL